MDIRRFFGGGGGAVSNKSKDAPSGSKRKASHGMSNGKGKRKRSSLDDSIDEDDFQETKKQSRGKPKSKKSAIIYDSGTVPAPVAFGAIIDTTCFLWEYDCDGSGNCWLYDNKIFSRYILILALCIKFGSLLFFIGALLTYRAPPETPADTAKVDDAPDINNPSVNNSSAPLS